jgi:hypothetical protein
VSQGIRWPEERERDGETAGQWSRQKNYTTVTSTITDYKYNNNEKVSNVERIAKM